MFFGKNVSIDLNEVAKTIGYMSTNRISDLAFDPKGSVVGFISDRKEFLPLPEDKLLKLEKELIAKGMK